MHKPIKIVALIFFVVAVIFVNFPEVFLNFEYEPVEVRKAEINVYTYSDSSAITVEDRYEIFCNEASSEMFLILPDLEYSELHVEIDGIVAREVFQDAWSYDYKFTRLYNQQTQKYYYELSAFYPSREKSAHTILFRYNIENMVEKYKDCTDFYYQVFKGFEATVKNLSVKIHMPEGFDREQTYIWGHGDPNGRASFVPEQNYILFQSERLEAGYLFEIRVVNVQQNLYNFPVTENYDNLNSILAEEQSMINDTRWAVVAGIAQQVLANLMLIFFVLYVLFGEKLFKRNNPEFNQPYVREVPKLSLETVSALYKHYSLIKTPIGDVISATLLNLTHKKYIELSQNSAGDITFSPIVSEDKLTQLSVFEKEVYSLIFTTIAKWKKEVSISDIKKHFSSNYEANNVIIRSLEKILKEDFAAKNYVDPQLTEKNRKWKNLPYFVCGAIIVLSATIGFFTGVFNLVETIFVAGLVYSSFVPVYFKNYMVALNVQGENDLAEILALKNFYTDLTLIKERQTLELPIWEEHLVYATVLGVSEKVIKELEMRLRTFKANSDNLTNFVIFSSFIRTGNINSLSRSFSSFRTASLSSFRKMSTSNGGGGGFSGGGGRGGGGRGGGFR